MPSPNRIVPALALGIALSAGACGSDEGGGGEKIPIETSEAMLGEIDQLETAAGSEDCNLARDAASRLQEQVGTLGDEVDPEIREALAGAAAKVDELVASDVCAETGTTDEELEQTTEPPTTTEETTTQTTTTTEEEKPPPKPPGPPEQPPGEGGGQPPGPPGGEPPPSDEGDGDEDGGTGDTGGTEG